MCASRVSTGMHGVWYQDLDVEAHQVLEEKARQYPLQPLVRDKHTSLARR